jgi:hypothetical protein
MECAARLYDVSEGDGALPKCDDCAHNYYHAHSLFPTSSTLRRPDLRGTPLSKGLFSGLAEISLVVGPPHFVLAWSVRRASMTRQRVTEPCPNVTITTSEELAEARSGRCRAREVAL